MAKYIVNGRVEFRFYAEINCEPDEVQECIESNVSDYIQWDTAEVDVHDIEEVI